MQTLSNLDIQPTIFLISKVLKSHLNERLSQYLQASKPAVLSPQTQSITFNFKDTSYTAEEGGGILLKLCLSVPIQISPGRWLILRTLRI